MLNQLAPHSRVWIFQADRSLTDAECNTIRQEMDEFISKWASHGNDLYGQAEVAENFFLIVGVDEKRSPTSGCSLDALNRKVKETGTALGVDFFNRLNIAVEADHGINLLNMGQFKELARRDEITGQTTVYNNLIENVGELRENWKTTVSQSWHRNLMEIL